MSLKIRHGVKVLRLGNKSRCYRWGAKALISPLCPPLPITHLPRKKEKLDCKLEHITKLYISLPLILLLDLLVVEVCVGDPEPKDGRVEDLGGVDGDQAATKLT